MSERAARPAVDEALRRFLDDTKEARVEAFKALLRIPSVSGLPEHAADCRAAAEFAGSRFFGQVLDGPGTAFFNRAGRPASRAAGLEAKGEHERVAVESLTGRRLGQGDDLPPGPGRGARQEAFQLRLAFAQGQRSKILAVELQEIKRVQHGIRGSAPRVERVEDGDAIRASDYSLAVHGE